MHATTNLPPQFFSSSRSSMLQITDYKFITIATTAEPSWSYKYFCQWEKVGVNSVICENLHLKAAVVTRI